VIGPSQGPLSNNTKRRKSQTSTPLAIPESERPQTHAIDRAAIGVGEQGDIKILLNCGYFEIKINIYEK
jgi:hypothetical protein